MSDVLYLINSRNFSEPGAGSLRELDDARISFIRGRGRLALASIERTLSELDATTNEYRDVVAFRLLVAAMTAQDVKPLLAEAASSYSAGSAALDIMLLCLEGSERWLAGDLIQGLWLNQSAFEHAQDAGPIWCFYAGFLLAKRLIDLHVPYQADRVIRDTRELVESAGLFAFGPMPTALESVRHWQDGRLDQAERAARHTMRLSRQYSSAFGVKIALSVRTMVHLGRGEWDKAADCLETFRAGSELYGMPDSVARAAFGEAALVYAVEGPKAAAERIRAAWALLGTGSGYLVEDPARPAWLVAVALQAGDTELAERSLRAIERLVENNRGVALLEKAAAHARTAMAGGRPDVPTVLPFDRDFGWGFGGGVARAGAGIPPGRGQPAGAETGADTAAGTGVDPAADTGAGGGIGVGEGVGTGARVHVGAGAGPGAGLGGGPGAGGEASSRGAILLTSLTDREREIARLVGQGMTNQQVALRLGLSPHTVSFHLRNVFRKFSISTRVKLSSIMAQAERAGTGDGRPD
ncbi:LuxR C-terminal-related transcriptional regulator [Streptomyces eurythermus]|uniref:helix-turn-helix transcriptional regulator n=1 Tax=Streptomyces eurythermus TaxID=42237 RepID=UPI0036A3752C